MKRFKIQRACVALVCLVAVWGFTGCDNSDDDPPDNISGAWATTFTRAGETTKQETWTFAQNGTAVSGSYTFGINTWAFTGTYVDGAFNGIDRDNWVLQIQFTGDSGSGTIAGDGEVWNASLSR